MCHNTRAARIKSRLAAQLASQPRIAPRHDTAGWRSPLQHLCATHAYVHMSGAFECRRTSHFAQRVSDRPEFFACRRPMLVNNSWNNVAPQRVLGMDLADFFSSRRIWFVLFKLLADLVVFLHAGYVAFIVIGQLAILAGIARGWRWVRSRRFRLAHLAAIFIVVAESLLGIVCPLTTLEQWLRSQSGQATYRGDFLGYWVHEMLFFDAPPWNFTILYAAFGLIVATTFWLSPPGGSQDPHD
jgi:hypothetical protein